MGSPSLNPSYTKYTGNGNAAAQKFELGFRPKKLHIVSENGQVLFWEKMGAGKKIVDTGVPTDVGAGELTILDDGFEVASTDVQLNEDTTEYFVEAY